MLVIPAIDLLDGKCVRLYRGDYNRQTVYAEDPLTVASLFQETGAKLIHIVDLDRARGSLQGNRPILKVLAARLKIHLEVGGGVRSQTDIKELLDLGIRRLIIGTALITHPDEVASWIAYEDFYPIAGIDAEKHHLKTDGWTTASCLTDLELAAKLFQLGFKEIIYTNIAKDGTLSGPDLQATNAVAETSGLPTILSGGIGSLKDLDKVFKQAHPLVKGVIVGKAIYEKRFSLATAIRLYQTDQDVVNQ